MRKGVFVVYANNKDPDLSADLHNRINVFAIHQYILQYQMDKRTANPHILQTHLFKYIENFATQNWKVSDKNSDIFHIFAKNIDCGYSLEPPCRGGSNEYPQAMFLSKNKKNNA